MLQGYSCVLTSSIGTDHWLCCGAACNCIKADTVATSSVLYCDWARWFSVNLIVQLGFCCECSVCVCMEYLCGPVCVCMQGMWRQASVPPLRILAHYPEVTAHAWPLPHWPPWGEQSMLGYGSHVLVTDNLTSCPSLGETHREKYRTKVSSGFYLPLAVLTSSTLTLPLCLSLLFICLLTIHCSPAGPAPGLETKYSLAIFLQISSHMPLYKDMSHMGLNQVWMRAI